MDPDITRVVLADDHARIRAGIRNLLDNTPDIVVVGEAQDGAEALQLVEKLAPDVLLLDVEMPLLNGNEVAAILQENQSPVRILALSAHDDSQYVLGMLNNGASGYLTKEEVPEILIKAVRGVARGERGWVSSRVADKMAIRAKADGNPKKTFTLRELEILRGVVAHKTDLEIAEELNISQTTVERHINMLCSKLMALSREDLIRYARKEKLI